MIRSREEFQLRMGLTPQSLTVWDSGDRSLTSTPLALSVACAR